MVDVGKELDPQSVAALFGTQRQSSSMKRTSDWIFSQEMPSDITVLAAGATFSLHKYPLISKCGYIRKLVSEVNDLNLPYIEIPDVPGGAEAFELAVKFCYGVNFEITVDNISMLRCVAEHLEMTEDYVVGNLVSRAEDYLNEVALMSLPSAITVLHRSESLLPVAETVKLVSRCIDAIAVTACNESQFCLNSQGSASPLGSRPKAFVDWWAEDLTVLRIDTFQRVLMAMKARGFKQYALGTVLMLYAQKSLRGLDIFGRGRKKLEPKKEHEKRVVLETVVSLLPREKNAMSVSFLTVLLRAAIYLETTIACRLDLEKRIGLQLGQAVLDDLLIPSFSFAGDTVFDVDTVQRILVNYLEHEVDGTRLGYCTDDDYAFPSPSGMERVGRLMESYLAEIASDQNLTVSRFVGLAELIPEQTRITEDGMYRAIDIFLKAHPSLSDTERKKVCSAMDCQRLSREACAHAAQNDRLPVQIVVQVLYYEQQRLHDAMTGGFVGGGFLAARQHVNSYDTGHLDKPVDMSRLQKENDDLRLELARMKMQLKDDVKDVPKHVEMPSQITTTSDKPPLPKKSLMNSVSKKLGKLNPFGRSDGINSPAGKAKTRPAKSRRHSIS